MVIFIIIAINLEMIDRNFSHVIKLLRISIFFSNFQEKVSISQAIQNEVTRVQSVWEFSYTMITRNFKNLYRDNELRHI